MDDQTWAKLCPNFALNFRLDLASEAIPQPQQEIADGEKCQNTTNLG